MAYATNKEKKKKRSAAIPLKNGNRIVLKKGKGSKRKYNGRNASVLEYPSRGGWMTVATFAGNALKWRKGQWIVKPSEGYNVHNINDDLWCNIFSFLVGPIKKKSDPSDLAASKNCLPTGVGVKDAKEFYSKISKVCKRWKNLCDSNMTVIFGHINANLDALLSSQVIPHMHWMIKHKVSIGILVFCADYGDIPFLVQLLDTCDTTRLTVVKARCNTIYIGSIIHDGHVRTTLWISAVYTSKEERGVIDLTCSICRHTLLKEARCNTIYIGSTIYDGHVRSTLWISAAYTSKKERGVIDLTCSICRLMLLKDMCDLVGVPYSRSHPKLRQLHDAIAYNCKNLSELLINLDIPAETQKSDLRDHLSESLFSPDLRCKLHLSLSLPNGIISPVMDIVLENLVNLELLSIGRKISRGGPMKIRLNSKHLRSLDISQLMKLNFMCGNLPNLKTLRYFGGLYSGGFVPVFLDDEKEQRCIDETETVDNYNGYNLTQGRDYHYRASEVRIHRLSIPPECEIIAKSLNKSQW
eukprot:CAMPEP_0194446980 /NCGR_PEP_ID=MMETSP0176-20130528/128748_1 /TAXON_ID=216777 /ORGANISM="Proboscia alata, Strain PI-D3" /LENGTH=524 /DNA_ID=CAMNT_0039273769 /DNA_START=92 /DNA_END=1664 /DNA_ORIENTATION=+